MYKTIIKEVFSNGNININDKHYNLCDYCNMMEYIKNNNTYMPAITKIVFNLFTETTKPVVDVTGKKVLETYTAKNGEVRTRVKRETIKLDNPVLTTVVYFADGSKSVVVNSKNDTVRTVERVVNQDEIDLAKKLGLPDVLPQTVIDADEASKENGIVYAIFKRLYGVPKADGKNEGKVVDSGTSATIRKLVDCAYDTNFEAARQNVATRINIMKANAEKASRKEAQAKVDAKLDAYDLEYATKTVDNLLKVLTSDKYSEVLKHLKAKLGL